MREGTTIAILSLGTRLAECLKAADQLETFGLPATVADARFMKPLDRDLIDRLARDHEVLVTVEEGSIGGFGSHVLHYLANAQLLEGGLRVRPMVLPDLFIDQGNSDKMYEFAGLNATSIAKVAAAALGTAARSSYQFVSRASVNLSAGRSPSPLELKGRTLGSSDLRALPAPKPPGLDALPDDQAGQACGEFAGTFQE